MHGTRAAVMVLSLTLIAAAGMWLLGCGGSGSAVGGGTVTVLLTDAPVAGVNEVHVNIVSIELVTEDEGSTEILSDVGEFDLIQLAGDWTLLGEVLVPPGTYNQVRLILAEEGNYIVIDEEPFLFDLTIPSGPQTGAKMITGPFVVAVDSYLTLMLDFDAAASIHRAGASGQWIMRPTVRAIVALEAVPLGSLEGTVLAQGDPLPEGTVLAQGDPLPVPPEGQILGVFLSRDGMVYAQGQVALDDGSFSIPSVLIGSYSLEVSYADTDWQPIGGPLTITVDGGDATTSASVDIPEGTITVAIEVITD